MEEEGSTLAGLFYGLGVFFSVLYTVLIQLFSWLLYPLYLLATPLLYLLNGLLTLALLPLRFLLIFEVRSFLSCSSVLSIFLLEKLTRCQTFIYFVTGAVLTGVSVGLFLHYTGGALSQLLQLQPSQQPLSSDFVDPKEEPIDWESKWGNQFLSSTILEEEENSQSSR